jgi:protein arginine N-methyltransferase 1
MYDLLAYGAMIADQGRTSAYARALERLVRPDSVVLDLGSGPGILTLLACRAGAARVYAVEPSGVIEIAREAAAANNVSDRIRFIQAMSTDIDLPESVDGIVSDLHGVMPYYKGSAVSIADARERFLKPGGWLIPAHETIWGTVVSSRIVGEQMAAWQTEYGFDLSGAERRAASQLRGMRIDAADLVASPQLVATLDYQTASGRNMRGQIVCAIERAAVAHGIAVWFDSETAPGIGFSNSPASGEEHIYQQLIFAWPEPLSLAVGDGVAVDVRADLAGDDYVWTWKTDVTDVASGRVKASYRQSSLSAEFLGTRLHKRADTFVADLNDDARIDREILTLMERKRPLGEIAAEILAAFPSAFTDWNAALGRVGALSDRYSR